MYLKRKCDRVCYTYGKGIVAKYYLGSDVPEQVFYVLSDEGILHDSLPVHLWKENQCWLFCIFELSMYLQDLLEFIDVIVLRMRKF